MASNLKTRYYHQKARRAHKRLLLDAAGIHYMNALLSADSTRRARLEADLKRLRADATPIAILYASSPGQYLHMEVAKGVPREDLYRFVRLRALEFQTEVILETLACGMHCTPDGRIRWCPKVPEAVRETLQAPIPSQPAFPTPLGLV